MKKIIDDLNEEIKKMELSTRLFGIEVTPRLDALRILKDKLESLDNALDKEEPKEDKIPF